MYGIPVGTTRIYIFYIYNYRLYSTTTYKKWSFSVPILLKNYQKKKKKNQWKKK